MPRTTFDTLPPTARLWIFAADRELDEPEADHLLAAVDRFLDDWTAHRQHLTAAREWRHARFLLVGVDESMASASGCSIDALIREITRLEQAMGVTLADSGPVLFRQGTTIERVTREQFLKLAASGVVGPDTSVFDNTLATVNDLRAGRWELPARETWHARAFF